jgi:C2H2 transcription facotor
MQQYYTVGANSPTGYSTPTSATFSVGTNSPRFSSGLHSPASSISRSAYQPQQKGQNRRLSVPSANPFQTTQNNDSYSQSYMSPVPSAAALSRAGAQYAGPINSYADPRRDLSAAEAENRRRTWHPNTTTGLGGRLASSGVGSIPVPQVHKPLFPPQQLPQPNNMRLPGIETFDNLVKAPLPPAALIRRQPSPMELDPPPTSHPTDSQSLVQTDDGRPNRISWTAGLRNGLNQLDISGRPQESSTWNPANPNAGASDTTPRPTPARPTSFHSRGPSENLPSIASHPDEMSESEDHPVTPRRAKRMGWYMQPPTEAPRPHQPITMFRTSPDSSSDGDGAPTPVTPAIDTHPTIVHSNGQVDSHSMEGVEEAPKSTAPAVHIPAPSTFRSGYPQSASYVASNQPNPFGLPRVYESSNPAQFSHSREPSSGMNRLEALVAVATSEEQRV